MWLNINEPSAFVNQFVEYWSSKACGRGQAERLLAGERVPACGAGRAGVGQASMEENAE
jgi:hypothetical protein